MITHDLVQGSDAWNAFRLTHFGASEAAAMLGLSRKVKRNDLLHMKATGTPQEFSDWVRENILDKGHEVEALARPNAEAIAEDDFYPVTCSDGLLSASCDGLNMVETIGFEHKQWNEEYAELVRQSIVPEEHMPQCQQCLMITGAEKWLFMISDGTSDKCVWTWVTPDPEWFKRLRAGWAQFELDLKEHKPRDIPPKPMADSIMALPTLNIQIRGEVAMSNLPAYRKAALAFIENIKTELVTDEDFADAEATVKFCDESEKKLQLAKDQALSQTASIDELLRTIDHIKESMRQKRLTLSALVESEKKDRKEKIIGEARGAWSEHVSTLESEVQPIKLASMLKVPDFVSAAKNKRTIKSLHDAVDTELANSKIAAGEVATGVRRRLAWYMNRASQFTILFADLQQLVAKADEDFQIAVDSRIDRHLREESERKAREEEQRQQAENQRRQEEEQRQHQTLQREQSGPAAQTMAKVAQAVVEAVLPMPANRRPADNRPPITTGTLCGLAGDGITITATFIQSLGFVPAPRPAEAKSGTYWAAADVPLIFKALAHRFAAIATSDTALAA